MTAHDQVIQLLERAGIHYVCSATEQQRTFRIATQNAVFLFDADGALFTIEAI